MEIIVKDLSELPEVAKKLLQHQKSKVILFEGEMGVGKTTLIKTFCKELNSQDVVSSPTFSLVNHYLTADNNDIFHFDFYRINSEEEAINIGFEEYLDKDAYCLIEWGERIQGLLPEMYDTIQIQRQNNTRVIHLK